MFVIKTGKQHKKVHVPTRGVDQIAFKIAQEQKKKVASTKTTSHLTQTHVQRWNLEDMPVMRPTTSTRLSSTPVRTQNIFKRILATFGHLNTLEKVAFGTVFTAALAAPIFFTANPAILAAVVSAVSEKAALTATSLATSPLVTSSIASLISNPASITTAAATLLSYAIPTTAALSALIANPASALAAVSALSIDPTLLSTFMPTTLSNPVALAIAAGAICLWMVSAWSHAETLKAISQDLAKTQAELKLCLEESRGLTADLGVLTDYSKHMKDNLQKASESLDEQAELLDRLKEENQKTHEQADVLHLKTQDLTQGTEKLITKYKEKKAQVKNQKAAILKAVEKLKTLATENDALRQKNKLPSGLPTLPVLEPIKTQKFNNKTGE